MKVKPTAAILAATLASACEFGEDDAKIPGEPLGTFHVVAQMQTSTCGPEALGAPQVWEFDVLLSRDGSDLYWLNGEEPVYGRVAADGVTFSFDTRTEVVIQEGRPGVPGCAIARADNASGQLSADGLDVGSFQGQLRYGYVPTAGSECSPYLGTEGAPALLPCEIAYAMEAVRTEEPERP